MFCSNNWVVNQWRPETQLTVCCLYPRKVEASRPRESPAGSLSDPQRPGGGGEGRGGGRGGEGGGGGSSTSEQSHSRNGQTIFSDFTSVHPSEDFCCTKVIFLPAGASNSRERSSRDPKVLKDKTGSLHLGTNQTGPTVEPWRHTVVLCNKAQCSGWCSLYFACSLNGGQQQHFILCSMNQYKLCKEVQWGPWIRVRGILLVLVLYIYWWSIRGPAEGLNSWN